jgi:hypothetical protein
MFKPRVRRSSKSWGLRPPSSVLAGGGGLGVDMVLSYRQHRRRGPRACRRPDPKARSLIKSRSEPSQWDSDPDRSDDVRTRSRCQAQPFSPTDRKRDLPYSDTSGLWFQNLLVMVIRRASPRLPAFCHGASPTSRRRGTWQRECRGHWTTVSRSVCLDPASAVRTRHDLRRRGQTSRRSR